MLYGSLAWTGHGHASDVAAILGLAGEEPETVDPDEVGAIVEAATRDGVLSLGGRRAISFDRGRDIVFDRRRRPRGTRTP